MSANTKLKLLRIGLYALIAVTAVYGGMLLGLWLLYQGWLPKSDSILSGRGFNR